MLEATSPTFLIRDPAGGITEAHRLVLGAHATVRDTPSGFPELVGAGAGETHLLPSGGDDTQRIRDALARSPEVRLGPGTFTISGTITLGTGGFGNPGHRLVGSGVERTILKFTHTGVAVVMNSLYCLLQGMTLNGPGTATASTGVQVPFTGGTTGYSGYMAVRDVYMRNLGVGIDANNTFNFTIENVLITCGGAYGIHARTASYYGGFTSQLGLRNVEVSGGTTACIRAAGWQNASLDRVFVKRNGAGIGLDLSGGTGWQVSAVRTENLTTGVRFAGDAGTLTGIVTENCGTGIAIDGAREVVVNGCRAQKSWATAGLLVKDSTDVVVNAFVSDYTGTSRVPPYPAHIVVQNSPGIFFGGARIVNTASLPTWDVDVSAAGGRVLFAQQNFNPARVNSGGNYATL